MMDSRPLGGWEHRELRDGFIQCKEARECVKGNGREMHWSDSWFRLSRAAMA